MTHQSKHRLLAAAGIFFENPVQSLRFAFDQMRGEAAEHALSFGGIRLALRSGSPDLTVVRACLLGEFDEAFACTSPDAKLIVDAGGYIGLVSILMARRFPDARILCLEPSSENVALARKNCAPYPNISVLNKALGPESGRAVLRDRGTGQWGFTIAVKVNDEGEEVEVVSLADLMHDHGAARIDLLKLDIEGAEYELFEVAESWCPKCDVMIVELHEKIRPGVEALYKAATQNRRALPGTAEKRLSVRRA